MRARSSTNVPSALSLARNFKRAGGTAEQYFETCEKATRDAAARDNWRPSEVAATMADVYDRVGRVWGKKALASIERTQQQRHAERQAARSVALESIHADAPAR